MTIHPTLRVKTGFAGTRLAGSQATAALSRFTIGVLEALRFSTHALWSFAPKGDARFNLSANFWADISGFGTDTKLFVTTVGTFFLPITASVRDAVAISAFEFTIDTRWRVTVTGRQNAALRRLIAIDSAKVPTDDHFVRTLDVIWAATLAGYIDMGTLRLTCRGIVYSVCATHRVKFGFAKAFNALVIFTLLPGLAVANVLASRCIYTGPVFAQFVLRAEAGDIIARKALTIITDLSIGAWSLSIADAVVAWPIIIDADTFTAG